MNQTTNYQLSQWESTDRILMSDFNGDNAKIDAALKANADAIEAEAAARAAALAAAGDCQMEVFTYTGTGANGAYNPTHITFSQMPDIFLASGDRAVLLGQGGQPTAVVGTKSAIDSSTTFLEVNVTWNGTEMSIYENSDPRHQLNTQGKHYWVLGLRKKS